MFLTASAMVVASMGAPVNWDLLLECHRLQTALLHRHNLALASTNDFIAEQYAFRGNVCSLQWDL